MNSHVIVLELRKPQTKAEKKLYGETTTEDNVSRIFLNSGQGQGDLINTVFHELAHAICGWMGSSRNAQEEERISRLIGDIVEPCFRKYPRGSTKKMKYRSYL